MRHRRPLGRRVLAPPGVVVVALLAGCTTTSLKPDDVLDSRTGKGVVLFSLTTDNPEAGVSWTRDASWWDGGGISVGTLWGAAEWENPKGRLVALEVGAGSYEFWHYYMCRRHVFARVSAVPGKAIYLGNIHINKPPEVHGDCGGAPCIAVSQARTARDLALFRAGHPNVKPGDVLTAVKPVRCP